MHFLLSALEKAALRAENAVFFARNEKMRKNLPFFEVSKRPKVERLKGQASLRAERKNEALILSLCRFVKFQ
jgi:hypothetical protein